MPASIEDGVAVLRDVNSQGNAIPYQAMIGSSESYDLWIDDPVPGDSWVCRDYVLWKGKMLAAAGWPPDDMTIVTCWTEPLEVPTDMSDPTSGREYHAVLAVKFEGAIYILDNRTSDIYVAQSPQVRPYGYLWWKQQDPPGTTSARDARGGLI